MTSMSFDGKLKLMHHILDELGYSGSRDEVVKLRVTLDFGRDSCLEVVRIDPPTRQSWTGDVEKRIDEFSF